MRAVLLAASIAAAAAVAPGAASRATVASSGPTTIARIPAAVYAVAQSRTAQAWRLCKEVDVRTLGGRAFPRIRIPGGQGAFRCYAIGRERPGDVGTPYDVIRRNLLVLAKDVVSWSSVGYGNDTSYVDFPVVAFRTGRRATALLPSLWHDSYGGWLLAAPASDGSSIVFATTRTDWNYGACGQDLGTPGCISVRSSRISLVDARLRRTRIGTGIATLVAVAGTRVAFVPGHILDLAPLLEAEPRVEVASSRGPRLGSVALDARPVELALSERLGAVLTDASRLEWFDLRTLQPGGEIALPHDAHALAASGEHIVFVSGSRIYGLEPTHPKPRVLATAQPGTILIGPSLVGSRLLWAEVSRTRGTSSIRVLRLAR